MHVVKVRGARDSPWKGLCIDRPLPRKRISRIACGEGCLDVKVRVFQIQRKEPVPWAYFREDLLQFNWPFHKGAVQVSEIEDGS